MLANFCSANCFAFNRASTAEVFTSGSTPTPSQFVCVSGLIARANGTPMRKRSSNGSFLTGCAPPAVAHRQASHASDS